MMRTPRNVPLPTLITRTFNTRVGGPLTSRGFATKGGALMLAALAMSLLAGGTLGGGVLAAQTQESPSALETAISHLEYREIGPALMGGRIADLAVVESRPQTFYVGTASGGLWKTDNHGTSWTPLFDDQPTSSIGDVTLHQANPNLVWVGTGEPQNRQSSPWGNGVYKSTDGGRTWAHMGLEETRHVARILIHPRNPDIVYVAAVGDLWAPSEERGVFRSRDGGETWERALHIDQHTGAIDLAMDPADPSTIFAAMYQRQRTGWGFNGGGPGSGLYRTVDGGDSWTELTQGLPEGDKGRIGVDVYRHDGNLVYALVEADARRPGQGFGGGDGPRRSGLFRSTDRGETWERMSGTNPRPMYYSQVRIDPGNPDRIYVLGTQLSVSDDGGRTFRNDGAVQIHVDHHQLWINPEDSDHLILGSDGGVAASWDAGAHWRMFDNLAIGQFYAIGYDMRTPYAVCGGLQDNDAWCGPSNTRSFHGIRNQDWYETVYGDGFFTIVDPTDSTIVYSESQGGNMNRYDLTTGEKTPMRPIVEPRAAGDTTKAYRYNWNSPLLLSPHDPATVYLGANYLLRSRDYGMSWDEVGGVDLTKQIDRDTLTIMGVAGSEPQMSRNDGIATYGNLTAVSESPLARGLIYAGTDDGNLQVSRDDGETWENVAGRIRGLPDRTYVSRVVASAHEEGRVYATFDGHRNGDYAPYAYVSEDYGRNWRAIAGGLPDGWSVNVIVEHHRTPDLLFLGNEVGVYISVDRGERWVQLKNNLPTVPVDDLLVHPRDNDLIVGTHGRSLWILADVTPLEALAGGGALAAGDVDGGARNGGDLLSEAGRVFGDRSIMWAERGDWPFYGATYSAPNPPRGARIRYYLREPVESPEPDTATAETNDGQGQGIGGDPDGGGSEGPDDGEGSGGPDSGGSDDATGGSSADGEPPASGSGDGLSSGGQVSEDGRDGEGGADRPAGEGGPGSDGGGEPSDAPFALTITNAAGEHVRTLEAPAEAGINEVIWDWRHDPPYEVEDGAGGPGGGGGFFGGGGPRGPVVLPGTYTVSMDAGGETFSAEVEVVAEPRRPMSRADRMARQDALMSLHVMAGAIHETGQAIEAAEEQLAAAKELIEAADDPPEGLTEEMEALEREIEEIGDELDDVERNARVARAIQGSSTLPTADHLWQVDEAWRLMPELLDRLNPLIETRLPALNAQLYAEPVRPQRAEPVTLPARPDR